MNSQLRYHLFKRLPLPLLLLSVLLIFAVRTTGQEKPPRPITVTVSTAQHLNFGSIIPINIGGGSLEVYHDNSSSIISGELLQIHSMDCRAALFVVDAEPGVLINIIYSDNNLKLSNGDYQMKLQLSTPYIDNQPSYRFVTKGKTTYVYIGGILTVGSINANPSGSYSGYFPVTFIQE